LKVPRGRSYRGIVHVKKGWLKKGRNGGSSPQKSHQGEKKVRLSVHIEKKKASYYRSCIGGKLRKLIRGKAAGELSPVGKGGG